MAYFREVNMLRGVFFFPAMRCNLTPFDQLNFDNLTFLGFDGGKKDETSPEHDANISMF